MAHRVNTDSNHRIHAQQGLDGIQQAAHDINTWGDFSAPSEAVGTAVDTFAVGAFKFFAHGGYKTFLWPHGLPGSTQPLSQSARSPSPTPSDDEVVVVPGDHTLANTIARLEAQLAVLRQAYDQLQHNYATLQSTYTAIKSKRASAQSHARLEQLESLVDDVNPASNKGRKGNAAHAATPDVNSETDDAGPSSDAEDAPHASSEETQKRWDRAIDNLNEKLRLSKQEKATLEARILDLSTEVQSLKFQLSNMTPVKSALPAGTVAVPHGELDELFGRVAALGIKLDTDPDNTSPGQQLATLAAGLEDHFTAKNGQLAAKTSQLKAQEQAHREALAEAARRNEQKEAAVAATLGLTPPLDFTELATLKQLANRGELNVDSVLEITKNKERLEATIATALGVNPPFNSEALAALKEKLDTSESFREAALQLDDDKTALQAQLDALQARLATLEAAAAAVSQLHSDAATQSVLNDIAQELGITGPLTAATLRQHIQALQEQEKTALANSFKCDTFEQLMNKFQRLEGMMDELRRLQGIEGDKKTQDLIVARQKEDLEAAQKAQREQAAQLRAKDARIAELEARLAQLGNDATTPNGRPVSVSLQGVNVSNLAAAFKDQPIIAPRSPQVAVTAAASPVAPETNGNAADVLLLAGAPPFHTHARIASVDLQHPAANGDTTE